MDYEFKTLKELYDRITPALKCRTNEFKKIGYSVREADIWNYLTEKKWKECISLTLSEMVNDIFDVNGDDLIKYIIEKSKKVNPIIEE